MAQKLKDLVVYRIGTARDLSFRFVHRVDSLINMQRLRLYPLFFVVGSAVGLALTTVLRIAAPGVQGPFVPDYLAHWTGGNLMLLDADDLYDPVQQSALQANSVGAEIPLSWFVSPPVVAGFYAPFALLPYNLSGLLWLFVSAALLIWCVLSLRTLAPGLMARRKSTVILSILASPVVFELLGGGQDSAFILAVWLIGIRLITSNNSVWAGAVFGLGFAKPQLVMIIPLILIVTRNYRALASFTMTCALLLGISVGLVGWDGMQRWLAALSSPLYTAEVQQGQAWKMLGLPSLIHAFLPPAASTWAAPILTLLPLPVGAAILIVHLLKKNSTRDDSAVWIAALATTVTFSPHLATYDAILFVPVIVYLLDRHASPVLRVSIVFAFFMIYLAPALHLAADGLSWPLAVLGAPWAAVPVAIIWWHSIKLLSQSDPPSLQNAVAAASAAEHKHP